MFFCYRDLEQIIVWSAGGTVTSCAPDVTSDNVIAKGESIYRYIRNKQRSVVVFLTLTEFEERN